MKKENPLLKKKCHQVAHSLTHSLTLQHTFSQHRSQQHSLKNVHEPRVPAAAAAAADADAAAAADWTTPTESTTTLGFTLGVFPPWFGLLWNKCVMGVFAGVSGIPGGTRLDGDGGPKLPSETSIPGCWANPDVAGNGGVGAFMGFPAVLAALLDVAEHLREYKAPSPSS